MFTSRRPILTLRGFLILSFSALSSDVGSGELLIPQEVRYIYLKELKNKNDLKAFKFLEIAY